MKHNEKGFSAVEGLMIVLIVGMISAVGWYIWQAKQSTDKNLAVAPTSASKSTLTKKTPSITPPKASTTTPVAQTNACQVVATQAASDWKTFTDNNYKFSISYPATWSVNTSGGTENSNSHTPILNELLFTLPGHQGPQYNLEVTSQSLTDATSDWENSVKQAQSNSSGTTYTILNKDSCSFSGHDAIRINTKQSYGTTTVYDSEFYVAANGYAYKFSTAYLNDSDPFKSNNSLLAVVESLSIN